MCIEDQEDLHDRLEVLQHAVAQLEHEKHCLESINMQLKETLQRVEQERRRLKKDVKNLSLSTLRLHGSPAGKDKATAAKKDVKLIQVSDGSVAELQSQVSSLKAQLTLERQQKMDYVDRCLKTSGEFTDLHRDLSQSLACVALDPSPVTLELETRRLDETLNHSLALTEGKGSLLLSPSKPLLSSTPIKLPSR